MFSVERPVIAKFNVDAKPFEMFVPSARREPLSSESSDSSEYAVSPTTNALFRPATAAAATTPPNYADDSANTNSGSEAEGVFLDISDALSDNDNPSGSQETANNDGMETFVPPDDDLCNRIVKQVEFYFSDVNLTKDAFLLKHVKRNKEGYVSLKLISSFKKVKTLTKDWRVVAFSLKTSDKLVVNEAGTKVRRRDPLPPYDETTPTRTVIAMNLPLERPTVELVTELFSKCGEIALIRILRPGAPIPPDIKQYVNKHPGIGSCVCAVIEYVASESAQRAVSEMGGKNNDWRSMHVVEMSKGKKPQTNQKQQQQPQKKDSPKSEGDESPPQQQQQNQKKEDADKKKKRNKKRSPKGGEQNKNPTTDEDTSPESTISPRGRRKATSIGCDELFAIGPPPLPFDPLAPLNGRLIFNPKMSPLASPELRPRQKAASYSEGVPFPNTNGNHNPNSSNGANGSSPWVHRRRMAAKESGQSPLASRRVEVVNPGQNGNATKLLVPEGVVRMPRGPDGTNGFRASFGRGRIIKEDSATAITVSG